MPVSTPLKMVKFISAEEVLPLRSLMLRNGQPLQECVFPTDELEDTFHLGFMLGEELVSIASFASQAYDNFPGKGYQLRGMATHSNHGGKGYGAALIGFALDYLRAQKVDYIWCNARSSAASFYKKIGFISQSPEFDIPGIGFHYEMVLNLK